MIGVTGTDGKTSTASMIHQVLTASGIKSGMISTVSAFIGDEKLDTGFHVTTPDSPEIQAYLAEMVRAGMSHCVLESTSHGLAQGRVIAAEFDIAVVTNITHNTSIITSWENYCKPKGFFESLEQRIVKPSATRLAILNKDDQSMATETFHPRLISYSRLNQADFRRIFKTRLQN